MKDVKFNVIKTGVAVLMASTLGISNIVLADTQLNITGTIKASPCNIVNDTGSGISVNLGDNIQASTLSEAKSFTEWKPFQLVLEDCPSTTSSVTATFNGVQADENAELYKSTGEAQNVQIDLQDANGGTVLSNGKSLKQPIVNNATTYNLQARAYSMAGGATPGSIVGTVMVAFTYE